MSEQTVRVTPIELACRTRTVDQNTAIAELATVNGSTVFVHALGSAGEILAIVNVCPRVIASGGIQPPCVNRPTVTGRYDGSPRAARAIAAAVIRAAELAEAASQRPVDDSRR